MLTRREFVATGIKAGAVLGFPAIVRSQTGRPALAQGVASGDVTEGRALIWSRADRAARMFVEYSTSDRFTNVVRVPGPAALETSDFTARVQLSGLPAGQRIFYRVLFQDLNDIRSWSDPAQGSFITPSSAERPEYDRGASRPRPVSRRCTPRADVRPGWRHPDR